MKALQLEKAGILKLKDIPVPKPDKDEVLLKVTHCAVCRTDARMWKQGHRDLHMPRIPGHEICGILPANGQIYAIWPGTSCGCCEFCVKGMENLCTEMKITGFHRDGGFAEYVCVARKSLIPAPADLPGEMICLAEPLACTLNALEQSAVKKEQRVLIYGAGPVGLMMGMAARYLGAYPFIREISPDRIEQTETFRNRLGIALYESGGDFDMLVNAAPSSDIFAQGLPLVRPGGYFCLFSGLTDEKSIPSSLLNLIHYRQLHIGGAYGCTRKQMEKALNILRSYPADARLLIEKRICPEQVAEILPEILKGQSMKFVISTA